MNKMVLTYFYIVLGFGLMLAFPAWANFQAGQDAYKRGNYQTALATAQGVQWAGKGRALLEKEMSQAQIAQSQPLTREWKAKRK